MINKDNLKDLLTSLDFTEHSNIYSKHFTIGDFYLKVDFDKEAIIYPENKGLIINERQTCNLIKNENFVVLECVHRLFDKGYKPEHIELEPRWKSGLGASGGRADILVKNQQRNPLLIIECKTAGKEFDDAWQQTKQDGGQLLAYMDRERTTRFLCLYASDFSNGNLTKKHYIINSTDIGNLVEQYEGKDNKPLFYKDITDVKQWYLAWSETYKLDYKTFGIFEKDVQAYNIGKENISESDLQNISEKDIQGKYHQFATTLRQYNVSGRENAFDKLVNLFLCKIVDETKNQNELSFYWKGEHADTFFELQDRLQKLYQAGMKEFLGEDVTYIDNAQIDNAFRYVKNDPDATKDTIKKFFTQLKFFTNNDFAFIDVHNEKLFYQNSVVLLEIVRMLQDIRLCTNEQNQFLGDLFEGFLDAGVKQSEGQFFTPMPITKFILLSLPLQNIISTTLQPPKMIDYACGSGHFLNELAGQIKPFIEARKQGKEQYFEQIYGIEKEYRLSKVAKVSAYMYGQDQIKIIYADALAQHPNVKDDSYSVLVANPPYSVKGFLETLPQTDRERYSLLQSVDNKTFSKNNSIQCFFIERAKQLLKPGGVAGIIVPPSILTNTQKLEVATRELMLQYFDIVAIAEFGSKTFGKTGTTTVTLFLRRKLENPAPAEHYRHRVNTWFSTNTDKKEVVFEDSHLLRAYCQQIEMSFEMYQEFLQKGMTANCLTQEIFTEYKKTFEASKEYKDIQKKYNGQLLRKDNKDKIATIEAERQEEIQKKLNEYAKQIEQDKVYYFVLAYQQPKVLIVNSPADGKAQKQFLGYDWSGAKGKEGIKYLGSSKVVVENDEDDKTNDESFDEAEDLRILANLSNMKNIDTPLYDPNNDQNTEKLNYWIQQNFIGNTIEIPENLQTFLHYVPLVNLLDFKQKGFNKIIKLNTQISETIETQWDLVKLSEIVETLNGLWTGKKPPFIKATVIRNTNFVKGGKFDLSDVAELEVELNQYEKRKLKYGDIIVEKSGGSETQAVGRVIFFDKTEGEFSYSNFTSRIRLVSNKLDAKYLHIYLNYFYELGYTFNFQNGTSGIKNLNFDLYLSTKIPLPPIEIQQQIVSECEAIDLVVSVAREAIIKDKSEIDEKVESVYSEGYPIKKLDDICKMQAGKFVSASEINDNNADDLYPCYGGNGLRGYTKSFTHEGEFALVGRQGALCGNVHKVSGQFHATEHAVVVTSNSDIDIDWLYYQLKSLNLNQYATGTAQPGLSVQKILTVTTPVPPLSEQQKLVSEIEQIEKQIADNQIIINQSTVQKQAVMKKYL